MHYVRRLCNDGSHSRITAFDMNKNKKNKKKQNSKNRKQISLCCVATAAAVRHKSVNDCSDSILIIFKLQMVYERAQRTDY